MTEWHTLETQEAIDQIHSDLENGLSAAEAERRLAEYGQNELVERAGKGPWAILGEQFTGIMVVMLIISAVVSVILGETIDAIVIMVIVVLNAVLGFVQEYRAEQAMAALKRMAVPHVRVRRDMQLKVKRGQGGLEKGQESIKKISLALAGRSVIYSRTSIRYK